MSGIVKKYFVTAKNVEISLRRAFYIIINVFELQDSNLMILYRDGGLRTVAVVQLKMAQSYSSLVPRPSPSFPYCK